VLGGSQSLFPYFPEVLFLKVLLINPKISMNWSRTPTCPLGLLSIASFLIHAGHTVKIFDNMVESKSIKRYIRSFDPDIVGLSVISPMASADAVNISKYVKKLNKPVVWGGHITSALPELCFREGCVDYIVIGEGGTHLFGTPEHDGKRRYT
jgi:radical SAM superfamily enzyme YgiQ (UPF0313 family)